MGITKNIQIYGQHKTSTADTLVAIVAILCTVMALFPSLSSVCAILIMPFMGLLFFHEDYYVLAAVFIFFTEQLTVTASAPIARVYQYLLFARFLLYDLKGLRFRAWIFPAFVVFAMYGVFVLPHADVSFIVKMFEARAQLPPSVMAIRADLVFKYFCDMFYMLIIATKLYTDKRLLDRFLKMMVFLAIISGVYGLRAGNVFNYKEGYVAGGTRQMASFNDPNYASCFINMAIFITLIKIHNKLVKIPIIIVLYAFLVGAGSMTGFLLNIAGIMAFAVLRYRKTAVIAIAVTAFVGVSSGIIITKIPTLYNSKAVQTIVTRISYQYMKTSGDKEETLNTMTSGRSGQWKRYMQFFNSQDVPHRLFGGNLLTTSTMDPYFTDRYTYGPHQAYIGFMINFGLVGLGIVMLAFAIKIISILIKALMRRDESELALFMTSFTWFIYGMALDYFFDTRFMMFFFL